MQQNILKRTVLLLVIVIFATTYGDDIPSSRIVNWKAAGLLNECQQEVDNWLDVENYSGSSTEKIVNALQDAQNHAGQTVIYLSDTNYSIEQTIEINNNNSGTIRFLGNLSSDTTTVLRFENLETDENCFFIKGEWENSAIAITQNIGKGSKEIFYDQEASISLQNDDWIIFSEPGLDDAYSDSSNYIGQVTQVETGLENHIIIKNEATKYYKASNNMRMREIGPVKNIGFENFKVVRENQKKGQGAIFKFDRAVNCWVKGVESYNCTGYHFQISRSSHILVSGCYIHEATNYDSEPGSGYGVVLGHSTTNCLIENNIFAKTRHAMLVGTGANCNVFGYNYSIEDIWDVSALGADLEAGDIRLHGRYPYANLFEGNFVDFVWGDATHGLNGPYNTIFRNKVRKNLHPFYNYNMILWNSDTTNVVANRLEGKGQIQTEESSLEGTLKNLVGEDYEQYTSKSVLQIMDSDIKSFYLDTKPEFFNQSIYTWPAIDINTEDNIIPAASRWEDSSKTYYFYGQLIVNNPINDVVVNEDAENTGLNLANVYQNPDNPEAPIKKVILSNSNPQVVITDIKNDTLTLDYQKHQFGQAQIVIRATSGVRSVNDTLHVKVKPVNDAPLFIAEMSDTTIKNDSEFQYNYQAYDPDNDTIYYTLVKQIEGLSLTNQGELNWQIPEEPETQYEISIFITDKIDTAKTSTLVQVKDVVAVEEEQLFPDEYALYQNYPNPFNPATTIKYGLPEETEIKISIYDVNGKLVTELLKGHRSAGYHAVKWHAAELPSGIYFYQIKTDKFVAIKKCILMK